ncbi:MAG TPA: formyltetrahydrofolate deformylase [Candidatus Binataceae bacterium]|nr:formyltetrahydrofolate deformylase [Candidatus Binataceae bacterium]
MASDRAILLISCIDRSGIIARVAGHLFELGCNIIKSDQYADDEDHHFFWRIYLESNRYSFEDLRRDLEKNFATLLPWENLRWRLHDASQRDRVVIMVSKFGHCMMDLLSRHHSTELDGDVVGVVANHPDLAPLVKPFDVPFKVIPVPKERKADAERELLQHLTALRADTVVLARYMQILSSDFLRAWHKPIINIHHSFLPAFAGARPHKQAHDRGVKLIGATAHYVTEDLDEGPIIAQATTPVTHRDTVADLARKGKDLEVMVLASAVRAHLLKEVLLHGNRTVVFE